MKSTFKIGSLEIQGVKLDNIEFTQEYTTTEAISLISYGKKFVKELLKEMPEMLDDAEKLSEKIATEKENDIADFMPKELKELLNHIGVNSDDVKIIREF